MGKMVSFCESVEEFEKISKKILKQSPKSKFLVLSYCLCDLDRNICSNLDVVRDDSQKIIDFVLSLEDRTLKNRSFYSDLVGNFYHLFEYEDENLIDSELFSLKEKLINIGVPCVEGYYVAQDKKEEFSEMIRKASLAMSYAFKTSRFLLRYSKSLDDNLERNYILKRDFGEAIKNGDFYIVFQPQYSCDSVLIGAEVLLRWKHKDLGEISPAEFIILFERYNSIVLLGDFLHKEFLSFYDHVGNNLFSNLKFSLNVSTVEMSKPNFFEGFKKLFKEHGISSRNIVFEVTETAKRKNFSVLNYDRYAFNENFKKLREDGFNIVLDDFGTGHATESFLIENPFSGFKVDSTFINNFENEKYAIHIKRFLSLAKDMNYSLVFEGVETIEQFDFLKSFDGNFSIQGYYFSKPLKKEEFVNLVKAQENVNLK